MYILKGKRLCSVAGQFGWFHMKKSSFPSTMGIFFLFFVPYIVTAVFNGMNTTLINRKFNVEEVLPVLIAGQIGDSYELETIKAQAIIARSNIYRKISEEKSLSDILMQIRDQVHIDSVHSAVMQKNYETAVIATESRVITWAGELKTVPYHELSAGRTRAGEEVFHSDDSLYLKSVQSSVDKDSKEFLNCVYINKNVLPEIFQIKSRDSAGYVMEILADGKILEGESFRKGMGLTSANFTVQNKGNRVRFLCRGRGHGMGFSQYGGNEMAKKSKTAEEILDYYFPGSEIEKISNDFRSESLSCS